MKQIDEITEQETAALLILRRTGMNVVDVAMIARDALLWARGRGNKLQRVQQCLIAGNRVLQEEEKSVSLKTAIRAALEARQHLRPRTLRDFRYLLNRLLKYNPGAERRIVSSLTPQQCGAMIELAFVTPRQRYKARLILSSVFRTAMHCGWCRTNPLKYFQAPRLKEQTIPILTPHEIRALIKHARDYRNGVCLPALGLMLYAGIRPAEVLRMRWGQIHLSDRVIVLRPQHSKTGGSRCVCIHAPLLQILRESPSHLPEEKICPGNWRLHWAEVRRKAGWQVPEHPWIQDILRHTYASYHLCYFRNVESLQIEMGHRSSDLLRTRYLNTSGVRDAEAFWRALPE